MEKRKKKSDDGRRGRDPVWWGLLEIFHKKYQKGEKLNDVFFLYFGILE